MKFFLLAKLPTITLTIPGLWKGTNCGPNVNNAQPCGLNDLAKLIINVANIAIALVGTVALIFLIIGGIQYITSAGNPDNIGKAKTTLLYSVIGLILVITAFAIISFITTNIK